jgi:NAD(P)-dependent dehydrogenase (short-subunit alcohol dehydrogenase family)
VVWSAIRDFKVEKGADGEASPRPVGDSLGGDETRRDRGRLMAAESIEGTVLVSGGTGALGRAVLAELLDSGAEVVSTWVAEREVEAVHEKLGDPDRLRLVEADLSSDEGADAAVEAASEGSLAGLVTLAGGFASGGRLHEAPMDEFERMVELNLLTAMRLARAAMPKLLEGGGSVVCVGARAALQPFAGASGYIVSKASVLALVRTLAIEYRDDGVRANAVLPSVIDTPANRAAMPDADHSTWVPPAEIARVIRFLVSGDSAPVSGALIPVYGQAA